jgi:hypothetical protein
MRKDELHKTTGGVLEQARRDLKGLQMWPKKEILISEEKRV